MLLIAVVGVLLLTSCGKKSNGKVKISADMFKDFYASVTGAKSAGIVKNTADFADDAPAETTAPIVENKSYFVTFDENNKIDKVVFRTTTEQGEVILSQDDINGQVDKMFVSGDFIFIMFTSKSVNADVRIDNPDYDEDGYICNPDKQSFVIHKATGKVYSLADTLNFGYKLEILGGNVVAVYSNKFTYYKLSLSDDNLVLNDIIPNKNIHVNGIAVDKFGHVFVVNDLFEETVGDVMYTKNSNILFKGDDQLVYEYDNKYKLFYYDSDWNKIEYAHDKFFKMVKITNSQYYRIANGPYIIYYSSYDDNDILVYYNDGYTQFSNSYFLPNPDSGLVSSGYYRK